MSQGARYLQLHLPQNKGLVLPVRLKAREGLSQLFKVGIDCLYDHQQLDLDSLLQQSVCLSLHDRQGPVRYFHGLVHRVETVSAYPSGYAEGYLELSPSIWQLSLRSDCRIFQSQSVVDIVKQLCQEQAVHNLDLSGLTHNYPALEYSVQYNESNLNFVSRLLESVGIYYYFKHDANGHTMMLVDDLHQLPKGDSLPVTNVTEGPHLNHFEPTITTQTQGLGSTDYDFRQPDLDLSVSANGSLAPGITQGLLQNHYAKQHYQTQEAGQAILSRDMQVLDWQAQRVDAKGNDARLFAGTRIQVTDRETGDYYIESIEHQAFDVSHIEHLASAAYIQHIQNGRTLRFVPLGTTPETLLQSEQAQAYDNSLVCISDQYPFAPEKKTPKPVMSGHQSATVTGPKGEAIYTDEYGRIKVQFHWDRYGEENEHSSCWIRVQEHLSGNGWGTQFIPRVGQEVAIEYIDQDPDRPMVVGTLYNGENPLPFPLPANQGQSGIKTHSIGSDDPDAGHMIRFDDKPNAEQLSVQSERDLNTQINHDETIDIHNNLTQTVQSGDVNTQSKETAIYAKKQLTLKAGTGEIVMTPSSIDINGAMVRINPAQGLPAHLMPMALGLGGASGVGSSKTQAPKTVDDITLQTIHVKPAWRKLMPKASFDDTATLARLPANLQQAIIDDIIGQYDPKSLSEQQSLSLPDLTQWTSRVKNQSLIEQAKAALNLDQAKSLRAGWIYVFAKCPANAPHNHYKKMHLFKEYESMGNGQYAEVDLHQYAGFDERPAAGGGETIELPYQFMKAEKTSNEKPVGKFELQVFFSNTQLSWPRLHKLGGLDKADPRLTEQKDKAAKQLIGELASKPTDDALRDKRAGQPLKAADLDQVYQAQYQDKKPSYISAENTSEQSDWEQHSLFYVKPEQATKTIAPPSLLLDDPVGMATNVNEVILSLQQKMIAIVNQLKTNAEMRTALLAYQFFFNLRADGITHVTNNHWYLNADESFKQKAALYAAVTKGQTDLDKDKFKLALKHWPRTIMKALITECQTILLNALQHNVQGDWHTDMDECIKDYFAKTGKAYGQAYLAYQGLWSLSCLDVNQIDAGFNLSTMPANTLTANHPDELDQEARHLPPSRYENDQLLTAGIYDETHTDSYQSVVYEQSGYEIYSTTKVFKIEPSKDSKQPQVVTLKISHGEPKALTPPPGFAYLKQLVKQDVPIAKAVMPAQAATSKSKAHTIYLNAEGQYNGQALHEAQQMLQKTIQSNSQTDHADATKDEVTSQLDQGLGYTSSYLDGLLDNLSQLAGMGDQAESDTSTKLKAKQTACQFLCDAAGLTRDAIQVGNNGGVLLSEAMINSGLRHYQEDQKALDEQRQSLPQNSLYQVPSTGEVCDTYEQAAAKIKAAQAKSTKDFSDVAPKAKAPAYIKKGLLQKQVSIHFGLCALAWLDIKSAFQSVHQQPDFYTITSLGFQIAHTLQETNEFIDSAAKLFGKAEALKHLKAKQPLINALTGEHYLKESANALECIGLIGGVFNMVTSTVSWATSCGNNDSALTASNFMGMLSNDLFLLSGIESLAEKQKAEAAEAAVKKSSDSLLDGFAEKTEAVKAGQAERFAIKIGGKFELANICEAIGDCIPGVDIICWIATAAQIASFVISLFEDNLYQQWAKQSTFANGDYDSFSNNSDAYASLLSLIASPKANVKAVEYQQNHYHVSLSSLAPQLDERHEHLRLKAFVGAKDEIVTGLSDFNAMRHYALAPVVLNAQPIYLSNTLAFVGERATVTPVQSIAELMSQHGLNLARAKNYMLGENRSLHSLAYSEIMQHIHHIDFKLYAAGNIQYPRFTLPNDILVPENTTQMTIIDEYLQKQSYAYSGLWIGSDEQAKQDMMIGLNVRLQNNLEDSETLIILKSSAE